MYENFPVEFFSCYNKQSELPSGRVLRLQVIDDILERLATDFSVFEHERLSARLGELSLDGAVLIRLGNGLFRGGASETVGALELNAEHVVGVIAEIVGEGPVFAFIGGRTGGCVRVLVLLVHVLARGGETMGVIDVGGWMVRNKDVGVGGVTQEFECLARDAGLDVDNG